MGGVGEANWTNVSKQLVGSLIAQVVFCVLGLICRCSVKARLNDRESKLRGMLLQYIGTEKDPPIEPGFLALCFLAQFALSTLTCIVWVIHVYAQKMESWMKTVYIIAAIVLGIHYFVNALKAKFHPSYFWSASAMIDSLTLAPMMMTSQAGYAWVNLAFLRMYRASLAVERLEDAGVMSHLTEFQISILWLLVRAITLMSLCASSIFVAEVLGPFRGDTDDDSYVSTGMGEISLFQMLYWVLTTISTVGYGDYSPTTMLARLLTMVCIVAGVVFFSLQTGEVMRIGELEKAGLGSLAKSPKPHIIVCGKAVHRDSGMLTSFLAECLHPDKPTLRVLLISDQKDPTLLPSLRGEDALRGLQFANLNHLVGSLITRCDQVRFGLATAAMVVVLGDSTTSNAEAEGEVNLMQALAVLRARPNIPIRLMLLTPRCRRNAIAAGIPRFFCISLDEVKTNLMALSCYCHGYSSMVLNLFVTDRVDDHTREARRTIVEPWQVEYGHGMGMEVYGFSSIRPAQTFAQLTRGICKDHGILLVGVQIDGRVQLAPMQYVVEPGTICFAMAADIKEIEPIHDGSDWALKCRQHRNDSFSSTNVQQVIAGWELGEVASRSGAEEKSHRGRRELGLLQMAAEEPDIDLTHSGKAIALPHLQATNYQKEQSTQNTTEQSTQPGLKRSASFNHSAQQRCVSDRQKKALADVLAIGSHIVVLALDDEPWAQIDTFAKMVNRPETQRVRNIVTLFSGELPSTNTLKSLEAHRVHFLEGSAQDPADLMEAGILEASAIVSLARQPYPGENPKAADAGTAVSSLLVEKIVFQETGGDTFAIFEWVFPPNVGLIPRYPLGVLPKPGFRDNCLVTDDGLAEEFDLLSSVRYASGRAITSVACGALCAQAYFCPGVMEVFDQLVYARGGVIPFQIKVPGNCIEEQWGKVFGVLLHEYNEQILPLGVLRAPYDLDCSKCSYVVTNPKQNMIIRNDDMIIVLATPEFMNWYTERELEEEESIGSSWANDFVQDVGVHLKCQDERTEPHGSNIRRNSSEGFNPLCAPQTVMAQDKMEIEASRPILEPSQSPNESPQLQPRHSIASPLVRRKDATMM